MIGLVGQQVATADKLVAAHRRVAVDGPALLAKGARKKGHVIRLVRRRGGRQQYFRDELPVPLTPEAIIAIARVLRNYS